VSSEETPTGSASAEAASEAEERAQERMLRRRSRSGAPKEKEGRRGLRKDKSASFLRDGDGPMVVMDGVTKVYDGGTTALDGIDLEIDSGEFVFMVGQSGSGKSTFMRLLTKELDASSGRVIIGGRDLSRLRRSRVPYLRRSIGCVFQDFKLLPGRTAYENVAYALEVIGESQRAIKRMVPEVLTLVGLGEKGGRYPHELSGGEQQRVSVARSFVNQPRLIVADEPTGNLDPDTSIGIMQLLYRINRTGTTVVMATHDRELVDKMQMRVVELEHGQVVRDQRQARYALAD
jgi:cell division transport system ATP-binding protein